ncbi:MAG TPA: TonB-dependent receptor [Sphingopyxis sp.]|uniref:TonB-dependent receptor domain-containing protein n=1 Tax=Sphingopyxis sp. TaxID=1908224 RepID=UPI002BFD3CCB|nr:TonB-dependent receptor [Sphingopyxis sp.]HWW57958.1 TonB-dependent receptor [Sphingopyxis sp.]
MRVTFGKKTLLLTGLAAGAILSVPAGAQESGEGGVSPPAASAYDETIVVTARRRDETLFETPSTVTAVSGQTLRDSGVSDIQSIIALTPNAVIQSDPSNFNTYINIRGIRQSDVQAEPNFGLYRNGIFNGGQRSNLGPMVDVERVEVLRGPQGGLYGRSAVGGAVNVVYAMPKDKLGGYASARYGRYQRAELEGAINLPVSDDFALRAAGWFFDQNKGEFYNVTLDQEVDKSRSSGVRLSARYAPGDDLEILWSGEYSRGSGPATRSFAPDGVTNFLVTSAPETPRTIARDTPSHSRSRTYYLSQTINYDSDIGRFSLLAAYRNYKLTGTDDQDGTAIAPTDAPLALRQRLDRAEGIKNGYVEALWSSNGDGPLGWIAGASYFRERFDFSRIITTTMDFDALADPVNATIACGALLGGSFTPGDPTCQTIPGGPSVAFVTSPFPAIGVRSGQGGLPSLGSQINTEAFSAFAELTYDIGDALSVTGGLRYTHDIKKLDYDQSGLAVDPLSDAYLSALFANVLPAYSLKVRRTFDNWAPSLNIRYQASPSVNLYANYSTGFRPGGFNTTSTTPQFVPYDQEDASNYELGFKGLWMNGKLGLNLAFFYMTQSNLVLSQNDPIAPPQFGFSYLANVGDARTWGQEAELFARVANGLDVAVSVGHLDAKFTGGASNGVSVKGSLIPFSREWTLNGRIAAEVPVSNRVNFVANANWRLEFGGVLLDQIDYENLSKLDLTAGFKFGDVRVVGYVNNLFNDRVVEFIFGNGLQSLSRGRTYGAEVSFTF